MEQDFGISTETMVIPPWSIPIYGGDVGIIARETGGIPPLPKKPDEDEGGGGGTGPYKIPPWKGWGG